MSNEHEKKNILITSSIPYVNAVPHIGFTLELLEADALARYYRLSGKNVFFLTGTDENAIKNAESAKKAGKPVQEFVDENATAFQGLKKLLNLTTDGFIRTTSPQHKKGAEEFWNRCKKDIYKKSYTGLYCTGCEAFYKEEDYPDRICPIHEKPFERVVEENYFFALSRYQKQLEEIIESDRIHILPAHKKQEVLNFIKKGLEDFSVSRPISRSKGWGIPVPGDDSQTIYVWFDALVNYVSGVGLGSDEEQFSTWWNDAYKIHLIGKDIVKFHLIYWPAMLLSAGLPLPDAVYVHEYINVDNKKMSKSLGNVIHPYEVVDTYGAEAYRYYFLREITPFSDSNFSFERFEELYSKELSNELGNLVLRLTTIGAKDGIVMKPQKLSFTDIVGKYFLKKKFEGLEFPQVAGRAFEEIRRLNKKVDDFTPWAKEPSERADFIREVLEHVSMLATLLSPLLPKTAAAILNETSGPLTKNPPLFPRLTPKKIEPADTHKEVPAAKFTQTDTKTASPVLPLAATPVSKSRLARAKEQVHDQKSVKQKNVAGKSATSAMVISSVLKKIWVTILTAGAWFHKMVSSLIPSRVKKSRRYRKLRRWFFGIDKRVLIGTLGGLILLCIFGIYFFIFYGLPNPRNIGKTNFSLSTQITDRNGFQLYNVFKDENRVPVDIETLPKYLPQAFVAVEDKDFYKHNGIVLTSGILRAIRDYAFGGGGKIQGGSTITQQLVKQSLLTSKRSLKRKLQEAALALRVEQTFTKDQILELYLNQVPFGGSSYGIEQAARSYFGKDAKDLSLPEAALIAGLPQAPSRYSPFANPESAVKRRNEVLSRMYEQKYITKEQYESAKANVPTFQTDKVDIKAPHFVFYVREQLEQAFGADEVEQGGLKVKTTLDYDIQASAEAAVREEVEKVKNLNVSNGAALVTRPSTGEILAMVGSKDYFATGSGSFNVTTATSRQPGSSIKPLVYAVGLETGKITPGTMLLDTKTCFSGLPPYCPQNYDLRFHGPVQIRFALANSYNIPAVKTMKLVGVEDFIASSEGFLIDTLATQKSRLGLSLALGGGEIPMTEMAQAFSTFSNQGTPRKLQSILEVRDKDDHILYEYKDDNFVQDIHKNLDYPKYTLIKGNRVLSPETTFLISHILLDNGARSGAFGSSSQLVVRAHPNVSVKTGTTNEKRDNWTIGYTPNFLVATWVGNNDNSPMSQRLASGITGAAPIWNRIMNKVLENQKDLDPKRPDGVVGKSICNVTGLLPPSDDPANPGCDTRFEYFNKKFLPGQQGVLTQKVMINKDINNLAKDGDTNVEEQDKTIVEDPFGKYCADCDPANTPQTFVK